ISIGDLNGPRHIRFASDEALLFQRLQVTHDAVGRADAKVVADFAYCGAVSAVRDLLVNKVEDLTLTRGKVGHTHQRNSERVIIWRAVVGAARRSLRAAIAIPRCAHSIIYGRTSSSLVRDNSSCE